jgi:excisionase family DNA binding protein
MKRQKEDGMAKLLTIREAALELSVSRDTIRRLIRAHELEAVRISRRVLLPLSEVERASTHGAGKYARRTHAAEDGVK